eukprot:CAMPEP_0198269930 /NCGR_PEP_ID=MMETSP1447-20131203/43181_1 /TAXON_ID=420782 /ORGANISM="Chaetoceros dichaeta, Strain CCMP1751" /LENGTH=722 /DNA_ID=CAMNT_0043961725 /DNA_START=72 /DNA_END=2243 /DNA_ORIENTATION=+
MSARVLTAGLKRQIFVKRPPANLSTRSLLHPTKYLPSSRSLSTNAARILTFRANSGENNAENNLFSINAILGATAATGLIAGSQFGNKSKTECCGIAAVIGKPTGTSDAREYLLEGLTVLKNRGYDSAGIATLSRGATDLTITKHSSDGDKADGIELVKLNSMKSAGHHIGIAHTRWATHGGKTDENAHPHTDSSGTIAIVHNGTINNANALRKELQGVGHKFTSQTDTEVIAKLIGHYHDESEKISLVTATERALSRCDGTWGLCVMCVDNPDHLIVACNGSPLVIGISDDRTFVGSETSAFNRFTKSFISMKDGEIGIIHADGRDLDLSRREKAPDQQVELSPAPFPHWTLKELTEQPEAIARALGFGGRLSDDKVVLGGLDGNIEILSKLNTLILSACGTSLNAAKYAEKLMKNLGSFEHVVSLDASETDVKDFPIQSNAKSAGVLVVSQSGETRDVQRVVKAALKSNIPVMSVVNAVGSLIARTTNVGVYCHAGRENAVASTKAFSTQVTVLALVALWFREQRDIVQGISRPSHEATQLRDALMRLPITFGMAMKTRDACKRVAERLDSTEHCFILGRGYGEPVAYEGALKIKEMCYLHAEGFSGGALKHGPFALIENSTGKFGATPIILLILDDEHAKHMRIAAEEVKARGADIIIITDKISLAEGLCDDPIVIPRNGPLTALGAVLPLQLIAYELALLRGINPDTPRNLAKSVTVD